MRLPLRAVPVACVAALILPGVLSAQMGKQATPDNSGADSLQTQMHMLTDVQTQTNADPKQKAAYEAFYKVNIEDLDKKIKLGNDFLQKYPKSPYTEAVDVGLFNAYYAKQDWKNFYATADNALVLKPDNVDVLTTVGWVIPHFYDPNDADADKQLDKAQVYEQHALLVIASMPRPAGVTDSQFAASKAQKTIQAHSALGLIYFRRGDYDNSARELQLATRDPVAADQTDLYVLGIDFQNTRRYADALDAFNRCGQRIGGLQDRCKQSADEAQKLASTQGK
jgi:tetratricopeptide (TPR) repeat protein